MEKSVSEKTEIKKMAAKRAARIEKLPKKEQEEVEGIINAI